MFLPSVLNFIIFSVCGKKAFLDRRTAKGKLYETYYCNDKHVGFRRKVLDDLVLEKGIELLSDEEYRKAVEAIVAGLESPFDEKVDKNKVETEIAKIDRKIARISSAIEDSDENPSTLVKRLAELEKERADLMSQIATPEDDAEVRVRIIEEIDLLRQSIIAVLQNEKSTTEELRNALSLFINSVVIYPENRVLIRHTLPGMAKVASSSRGTVSAPPEGVARYSQLIETWVFTSC